MERDKELEMLVSMMLVYVRAQCCNAHAYSRLIEALEICIDIGHAEASVKQQLEQEPTKETIQ